ncbi:MAG: ATP-binding protein [Oscillospiraceae bacterium]|jgi:AAA15 family ATPase/GTPase|nr:ATP-binding protein [Oscillospiraceae bacterium]
MLLQFNFKNFKSFRDDTTLDLTATKISEYSNHVIAVGNENVLPVAAIFGANASGKSNVQEAFRYMSTYVVSSFSYGGDESWKKSKSEFLQPTPFLFDANSKDAESSFEVYFISSKEAGAKIYNYGFTVDQVGINEEWLNYRSKSSRSEYKRIFYRNRKELDLSGIIPKSQENLKIALEKETLIVSLGAKLKIAKLKLIRDWFLDNEFADFGRPVENFFLSELLPDDFVKSKDVQQKVVNYFSAFDPSIISFEVERLEDSDDKKSSEVRIDAIHKMIASDETTTIPLKLESAGTLKMFALYPLLQKVLETSGVLFVDELNARLHPLLVRTFIITFLNPDTNPNHAQLLFTSHDSWQLNSNILRRDEVWFTEKTDTGISSLYSLADFVDEDGVKIRKDENYEKNYLLGKYGAIPTMKCFDIFKGE